MAELTIPRVWNAIPDAIKMPVAGGAAAAGGAVLFRAPAEFAAAFGVGGLAGGATTFAAKKVLQHFGVEDRQASLLAIPIGIAGVCLAARGVAQLSGSIGLEVLVLGAVGGAAGAVSAGLAGAV